MKKIFLTIITVAIAIATFAQNTFKAKVIDEKNKQPLIGATAFIASLKGGNTADTSGLVEITNIPNGKFTIEFTSMGYNKVGKEFQFPLTNPNQIFEIEMVANSKELGEVIISTTRTNSRIEDVPVKMEVIALDEIEEMTGINPTNVAMLLTEASGVQQQITSPTSGNVNARVYGLDGQYTQIVKDGFPMFSGYSSGFSIMQIPPLDLKQIEIVKGAASALYGGDAIAGVMNLVSKSPTTEQDFSVLLNQTQKLGTDISSYYAKRNDKFGVAVLATQNFQQPYDVNDDGFTDIPKTRLTTFAPKLFFYPNKKTTVSLLLNTTFDSREGGDMFAIKNKPDTIHAYIDKNTSDRFYSQLKFEKEFKKENLLTIKNGFGYYNRNVNTGMYKFGGYQFYSYSEVSYLCNLRNHKVVSGLNYISDQFNENKNLNPATKVRSYDYYTIGLFVQDDWSITKKLILQTGVRGDYQSQFKLFVLPRASMMYKFSNFVAARAGAGLGYKAPTIFSAGYDANAYNNVKPLPDNIKAEKSYGINGDVNWKHYYENGLSFNFNQAFFFTNISNTVIPNTDSLLNGVYSYTNANQAFQTAGTETNIRFKFKELTIHTGYTYTNAVKKFAAGIQEAPFVAKHRLICDAFYEIKNWNLGLEAFYTGKQYLGNTLYGHEYWNFAVMVAYKFKSATLLLNVENFTDRRQTRWEEVVNTPYNDPTFKPIYAPLNGVIANVSLRINF